MNEVVKNKWVSALRSGEYAQTQSKLRDDRGFCCLGVLCDLAVKDGIIPQPTADPDGMGDYIYGQNETDFGSGLVLPEKVAEWANLPSENPWVDWYDEGVEKNGPISNPNDEGVPFSKIADIIEKQL